MTLKVNTPLSMLESNTSEIEIDSIRAIAKTSESVIAFEDPDNCDLFERVHSLHQARQSVLVPNNAHRWSYKHVLTRQNAAYTLKKQVQELNQRIAQYEKRDEKQLQVFGDAAKNGIFE
eukprot:161200_1